MKKIIAVDFDGTCVTHEYPIIGTELHLCVETLQQLNKEGVYLVLWTMRSGEELEQAVEWFEEREIELFGVNENPEQKEWTDSPKAYAQLYIDDASLGCPTRQMPQVSRPFVDWEGVQNVLIQKGFLKERTEGSDY